MHSATKASLDRRALAERYRSIRAATERLCAPLAVEDYQLQSMPDCSPPKWHLAHTTWFFETFALASETPFNPQFGYLFNSYYEAVGERWPRAHRGLLSRPTVAEVYAYRANVDGRMLRLIEQADSKTLEGLAPILELGFQHEQQHQELLLTDLKHAFGLNPLRPVYGQSEIVAVPAISLDRIGYFAGMQWIGHEGDGFAFDNEGPRHRVFLEEFQIATRTVTNGEYLEFVESGGYDQPMHWLSDGWAARQKSNWAAPLYWERIDGEWWQFTLSGMRRLDPNEPVCHVSFYEAEAYCRWAGARLPTEFEWEVALGQQMDFEVNPVWDWTASPYTPYPGYRPAPGALGEYNGKFMCNQMVLRGRSKATPPGHSRSTYRNFFPPDARWQFSGFRLAKDAA